MWAQVVPDVEYKTLLPLIDKCVKHVSIICADTLKTYTGISAKGYVHRLLEYGKR
ncbi:MAG: transposase [Candidatus Thorarchaeota archaeon]